jgi:hypothetical protein
MIVGCTELPIILEDCLDVYDGVRADNLINATEEIADAVVRIAHGLAEVDDYVDTKLAYSKDNCTPMCVRSLRSEEVDDDI